MKLLTIRDYPEQYGAEGHMLRVAVGAAQRGWEVHAAFPQTEGTASMLQTCLAAGIRVHTFDVLYNRSLPRAALKVVRIQRTLHLLKKVRPDVAQITLGWPTEAPGFALACALANVPALVVFQLAPEKVAFPPFLLRACAWAGTRRQQWVAVSEQNFRALRESFQVSDNQLKLIYNGAESEAAENRFCIEKIPLLRREVRSELGVPENSRLLLTTGRLNGQKGHADILAVAGVLLQEFPDIRFVWAGTGEEQEALEKTVREQSLERSVLFLGYRSDVPRLLKASDLFLFPSHFEGGCSSSIREAMVHELPIVASDAGGIPEVVRHHRHGLLFPARDTNALHQTLRHALACPDSMQEMARNARARIQEFSAERMIENYLAAFEEIRQKRPGRPQRLMR